MPMRASLPMAVRLPPLRRKPYCLAHPQQSHSPLLRSVDGYCAPPTGQWEEKHFSRSDILETKHPVAETLDRDCGPGCLLVH